MIVTLRFTAPNASAIAYVLNQYGDAGSTDPPPAEPLVEAADVIADWMLTECGAELSHLLDAMAATITVDRSYEDEVVA